MVAAGLTPYEALRTATAAPAEFFGAAGQFGTIVVGAEADLLLHVIDSSHPQWEEQRHVVNAVLDELGVHGKATLHVFNKIDRVPSETLVALEERITNLLPNSVFVSA